MPSTRSHTLILYLSLPLRPPYPFPGNLDDLHSFDIAAMTWTKLSAANGTLPSARSEHGFTSAGGKLFVYGGESQADKDGTCMDPTVMPGVNIRACFGAKDAGCAGYTQWVWAWHLGVGPVG